MLRKHFFTLAIVSLLLTACSTSVDPTNPYDPDAPESIQAKGEVDGVVTLEGSTDPSGVTVALQGVSGTAQTDTSGKFSIKDVRQGTYVLALSKEGYKDLKVQGVAVPLGQKVDVGTLAISIGRGLVRGEVSLTGASDNGGATVTLQPAAKETATVKALAAVTTGTTSYAAVSGIDGRWEISNIPVGWYYLLVSKDGYETTCSDLVNIVKDGDEKTGYSIDMVATSALISFADSSGNHLQPYPSGNGVMYYTGSKTLKAIFNASGVTQYRTAWSEAGLDTADWEPFAVQKDIAMDSGAQDGEKAFWVEMKDQCQLTRKRSQGLVLDTQPPNVAELSVDGVKGPEGATYLKSPAGQATVRLHAEDATSGVDGYRLSVDKPLTNEPFTAIPATASIVTGLGTQDRQYVLYAEYKDRAGNKAAAPVLDARLDNQGPTGTIAVVGIHQDIGGDWFTSSQMDLAITGADPAGTDATPGSGVTKMKVWNDGETEPDNWVDMAQAVRWSVSPADGPKGIRLKLQDAVGNPAAQEITTSFTLYSMGPVSGVVQVEGGTDSSGVLVSVSGFATTALSNPDGTFLINDVPQGIRDVTFTKQSYKTVVLRSMEIKAKTGTDLGTIPVLKARGTVYGKAKLEDNSNSSGIVIALSPGNYAGYTDPDGNYRIDNVPVGTYTLTASKDNYATQTISDPVVVTEDGQTLVNVPNLQKISSEFTILDESSGNPHNTSYTKSLTVKLVVTPPASYVGVCIAEASKYAATCVPELLSNPNYKNFTAYQTFTLDAGDGAKELQARWLDGTGKSLAFMKGNTTLDTVAPVVDTVMLNSGAKYINIDNYSSNVTVTMAAHDVTSAVYQYRYKFQGASYIDWASIVGAVTVPWAPSGDGDKTVIARFRDMAGNESAEADPLATATINVNTARPTGTSIAIVPTYSASGIKYVKSTLVTVNLTKNGAVGLKLANDGNFDFVDYRNVSTLDSLSWELTPGDATKTVYARFYNAAGNYTNSTISDSVVLDTTPPGAPNISVTEAPLTNLSTVHTPVSATNASHYAIRTDTAFSDADWKGYPPATTPTTALSAGDGLKTVYAKFKDNLGNETQLVMATVQLDQTAPSNGSVKFASDPTNTLSQTIALFAIGATKMCLYGTDITGACDPSTAASTWGPYNTSTTITLQSGDTTKTVKVKFADDAGNKSTEYSSTTTLDTAPPVPDPTTPVLITGYSKNLSGVDTDNTTVTYRSDVKLTIKATGATKVAISNTSGACNTATYTDATFTSGVLNIASYLLQSGSGQKSVYVCFKDDAGNYTTSPSSDTIVLDQTSPWNVQFSINSGAVYTSTATVGLDGIAATDNYVPGPNYMMFSNCTDFGTGTGCNTTEWVTLAGTYSPWTLIDGTADGLKKIYMKARDAAGNESAVAMSGIILDTAKPTGGAVTIKQKPYTNSTQANLILYAEGAARMCIYGDITTPCDPASIVAQWQIYRTDMTATLSSGSEGTKTIYAAFADEAGNKTTYTPINTIKDTTTYDITAPTNPQLTINAGNPYTLNQKVTLSLNATHPPSGPYAYYIEGNVSPSDPKAFTWIAPGAFPASVQVDLDGTTGSREVRVKYKDQAGNESYPAFASIIYDPTQPASADMSLAIVTHGSTDITNRFTKVRDVDLFIRALDDISGVSKMQISRCSDFSGTVYGCSFSSCSVSECCTVVCPYGTSYSSYQLQGATQGQKYVYVRFQNRAMEYDTPTTWTSAMASNYIYLDTTAPTVDSVTVADPVSGYTKEGLVTLELLASDTGGSPYLVQSAIFAESPPGYDSYSWESYTGDQISTPHTVMTKKFVLTSGEGVKTVKVKVKDASGRESGEATRNVTLDRTPPSVILFNASTFIKTTSVDFKIDELDNYSLYRNIRVCKKFDPASQECGTMCNKDCSTADWENLPSAGNTLTWPLPGAPFPTEKSYTVAMCSCDQAGNVTGYATNQQVLYDKTNPTDPVMSSPVAGSSTVTLNWSASVDTGSNIDYYQLAYATKADFSNATISTVSSLVTTITVENLNLHTTYYFRIKAYDRAGNYSNWSNTVNAVTGWKKTILTPKPYYTSSAGAPNYKPFYFNDKVWIAASASASSIYVFNCDTSVSNCNDEISWGNITLSNAALTTVLVTNSLAIEHIGNYLFIGSVGLFTHPTVSGWSPFAWFCDYTASDCTSASNWDYIILYAQNSGGAWKNLTLASNGGMIAGVWGVTGGTGPGQNVSVCNTAKANCVKYNATNHVAMEWSAPIVLPSTSGSSGFYDNQAAAFFDDKGLFVFYRDSGSALRFAFCELYSGCDEVGDYYRNFALDAKPAGTNSYTAKNISVVSESDNRHLTWERYTYSTNTYERVFASCQNLNCGAGAEFWTAASLFSTNYSVGADMAISGNMLRMTWLDKPTATIRERACPTAMDPGSPCTSAIKWNPVANIEAGYIDGTPMITFYGPNPVIAIRDDKDYLRIFQPKIPGPVQFAAGPGSGGTMASSWRIIPFLDGYNQYYDDVSNINLRTSPKIYLPDPSKSTSSITPAAGEEDPDYKYSNMVPLLNGEMGEPTPIHQMLQFKDYELPRAVQMITIPGASGGPEAVMCMTADQPDRGGTLIQKRIAVAYTSTDGRTYVGYCGTNDGEYGGKCSDGGNWKWTQVTSTSYSLYSCSIEMDDQRMVIAGAGNDGKPYVFFCDDFGTTGCKATGNWTAVDMSTIGTLGTSVSHAKLAVTQGIIAVMYKNLSASPYKYHVKLCDTKTATDACNKAANWRSVDIDSGTTTYSSTSPNNDLYDIAVTDATDSNLVTAQSVTTSTGGADPGMRVCYCSLWSGIYSVENCKDSSSWTCGWGLKGTNPGRVKVSVGNGGNHMPAILWRDEPNNRMMFTYCREYITSCMGFGPTYSNGGYWLHVPLSTIARPTFSDKFDVDAQRGMYYATFMNRGTLYMAYAGQNTNRLFDGRSWSIVPVHFDPNLLGPASNMSAMRMVSFDYANNYVYLPVIYYDTTTTTVKAKILIRGMTSIFK